MSDQHATTKVFVVVDGPVKIRTAAGTDPATVVTDKLLKTGDQLSVEISSRTEAGGYVWWKHSAGWSAERTVDGKEVYMADPSVVQASQNGTAAAQPATPQPPPPPPKKIFQVTDGPLTIRSQPHTNPSLVITTQILKTGDTIEVDPASRTENDGYVWWKHSAGWSAERTADSKEVYMTEQVPPPPPKKIFLVTDGPVTIRSEPHTEPRLVVAGQTLQTGEDVEVDPASRTENDGYVWWKHSAGWSAERSIGGSDVFMVEHIPGQLPPGAFNFEKFPVAWGTFQWFYYYGNTEFAFKNGKTYNYDGYSQGLHGGIDFGHPGGAPIVAGVTGTFGGRGAAFPPNRLDVIVGNYRIIYGHLANPNTSLTAGQAITPDTPMGQVDGKMQHTHIEVRTSDGVKIVNPLQFIPDAMRNQIFTHFPAKGEFAFHPWAQWQSPTDQPDIILGGKLIGPRAQP